MQSYKSLKYLHSVKSSLYVSELLTMSSYPGLQNISAETCLQKRVLSKICTRAAPKVMPPIYFHGNYNRYKEHNNNI